MSAQPTQLRWIVADFPVFGDAAEAVGVGHEGSPSHTIMSLPSRPVSPWLRLKASLQYFDGMVRSTRALSVPSATNAPP